MAKRKVRFSLVYRDMWQSSGKYQPRRDELEAVAPVIIDMDCFDRVETNGGGFEQVQLLAGRNPNPIVRAWTKPFNEAGIATHMLERGLNGIRMYPCPADVRELFFKVKKAQGVDISRSFDGLNDVRNLEHSIKYAKAAGMVAQCCLCFTYSPIHTVKYYVDLAETLLEMGAEEFAIKDMAGVGRPMSIANVIKKVKRSHPEVVFQYHGHSGPGLQPASILAAVQAGCDVVDVAMEPLSWGTGHVDVMSAVEILRDVPGIETPQVNLLAYMKAKTLTQGFIDEWLGYWISPKNRLMNSMLLGPGLPGGMMGSLMGSLEEALKVCRKHDESLTIDDMMVLLFEEVERVWPELGYPPLVTPFSQYVATTALNNVKAAVKAKARGEEFEGYGMIDNNTWDMIAGKSGKLPGPLGKAILELAEQKGIEFEQGHPQDGVPDNLDAFREEMAKNGWDAGPDDEELFELAMHPEQYRRLMSGDAQRDFEAELAAKQESAKPKAAPTAPAQAVSVTPTQCTVTVNGVAYQVTVAPDNGNNAGGALAQPAQGGGALQAPQASSPPAPSGNGGLPIESIGGRVKEVLVKPGERITKGQRVAVVEAMKVDNDIVSTLEGTVSQVLVKPGDQIEEDAAVAMVQA